jgi:hypothetical protein
MRLNFTLIFNLLLSFVWLTPNNSCIAQHTNIKNNPSSKSHTKNITGIWRGYFIQQGRDLLTGKRYEEKYKYEVQINNTQKYKLEGVTYSYLNTIFYGKTSLQGIFTPKTNEVIIKENKMLELKMSGSSEACLMTCYLSYSKIGNKEFLKGDYSSLNQKTKSDCGEGLVYLEKVTESDFIKEDFLTKKIIKKPITKPNISQNKSKVIPKNLTTKNKLKLKPGAEDALVTNPIQNKKVAESKPEFKINSLKTSKENITEEYSIKPTKPLPKVLTERKNNLVKTFYVDEGELELELYDNGQIDNDVVSIYHNGSPVIQNERLTTSPIKFKIKVTAENPIQEFILVAENLGEIPPNTSLLKIKAGAKYYQVLLSTDLQKNAKIIFEYNPQQKCLNPKK